MWNMVHIKLENSVWSQTLQTHKHTLGLMFQQFLFLHYAPFFLFAINNFYYSFKICYVLMILYSRTDYLFIRSLLLP